MTSGLPVRVVVGIHLIRVVVSIGFAQGNTSMVSMWRPTSSSPISAVRSAQVWWRILISVRDGALPLLPLQSHERTNVIERQTVPKGDR